MRREVFDGEVVVDGGRIVRCRIEDCDTLNGNSSAARHVSLFNCLIVHNGRRSKSASGMGAVEYMFSGCVIVNCTFAGNVGQAIGHYPGTVYNCLFSENGSASWTRGMTVSVRLSR